MVTPYHPAPELEQKLVRSLPMCLLKWKEARGFYHLSIHVRPETITAEIARRLGEPRI